MNTLSAEKQTRIIGALCEGCSIRATERMTDTHRDTVMNYSVRVGQGCERLHDRMMRDLQVATIELDEQWDFIAKKAKRVQTDDPQEYGDVWLFVALAANQKAIVSYVIGKRTPENTEALAFDLRARILNRPQITSDGYSPYVNAIEVAFATGVDFAVLTKKYVGDSNLPRCGASLLARPRVGSRTGCNKRKPQPGPYQHVIRRALQSLIADADAPLHAPDKRIFKEAGKSSRRCRALDLLLQFLSRA